MVKSVKVQGAEPGDPVVITADGEYKGCIGRLEINPGFETVGVFMGCLNVRFRPTEVRPLRSDDRVVNP